MVAVDEWRECKECHDVMPLDRHHYAVSYVRRSDGVERFRHQCRRCKTREMQRRDKRLRHDPATRDAYLAERRFQLEQYAKRHPDVIAKSKRESFRRMMDDPERAEHYRQSRAVYYRENADRIRENARLRWHLNAEQEGRTIATRPVLQGDATSRKPLPIMRREMLPVAPIVPLLKRLADAYGASEAAVIAGVDDNFVGRAIRGEVSQIELVTGDRICCRLGFNLFDFWPDYA